MKSASLQEQLASGELDPRLAGFKRACLSQWYSKRFLWYSQTNGISSHNGIPGFLLLVFEALLFSRNHGWNLMELHQVPIAYAYAYDQVPIAYDLSKTPGMGLKTKIIHLIYAPDSDNLVFLWTMSYSLWTM